MEIRNMKYSLILALALAGVGCMPVQGMNSDISNKVISATITGTALVYGYSFAQVMSPATNLLVIGPVLAYVSCKDTEWVKQIKQNGLDNNLKDAIENEDVEEVEKCLRAGADPNCRLDWGARHFTMLHWATEENQIDIMELLLQYGADINALDDYGRTALTAAVAGTVFPVSLATVKFLVENGADVTIKDRDKKTAYNLAKDNAARLPVEIVQYLETVNNFSYAHDNRMVKPFLQNRDATERQDLFEIALANNCSDLEGFNQVDSKQYSWKHMLALAERKDLNKPVAFLMANIGAYPDTHTRRNIKRMYDRAKVNDHKSFGRAMHDFNMVSRELHKIPVTTGGDQGKTMPKELALKIMEFRG